MKPTKKRVLIADCHEDVLIVLEKLLEDAGFDTTTVWTANEMLSLADANLFDLLLIGEYLPDAQCEEVLKALLRRWEHTPRIVMQSSAPESADFARFGALGVSDIVCKRNSWQIVDSVKECLAYDGKQLQAA
jgi:DNA-binding response OmpR family regulator